MSNVKYLLLIIVLVNNYDSLVANKNKITLDERIEGGKNWTNMSPLKPYFMVAVYDILGYYPPGYPGKIPKLVADFKCGGSLIGPRTVLTAAQCCDSYPSRYAIEVHYEGTELGKLKQSQRVQRYVKHPYYNETYMGYDFCILTLYDPITETNNVTFIELANCTPLTGYSARIAGWGLGKYNETRKLKVLDMKILASRECKMRFNSSNEEQMISNESQICATSASGYACQGDQGGPLVVNAKLVGVISRPRRMFEGCTNKPNVFGDTVKVRDWILDNIV